MASKAGHWKCAVAGCSEAKKSLQPSRGWKFTSEGLKFISVDSLSSIIGMWLCVFSTHFTADCLLNKTQDFQLFHLQSFDEVLKHRFFLLFSYYNISVLKLSQQPPPTFEKMTFTL